MRFLKRLMGASLHVSVPALAAKAEYTREEVAKVDCDRRCLMSRTSPNAQYSVWGEGRGA